MDVNTIIQLASKKKEGRWNRFVRSSSFIFDLIQREWKKNFLIINRVWLFLPIFLVFISRYFKNIFQFMDSFRESKSIFLLFMNHLRDIFFIFKSINKWILIYLVRIYMSLLYIIKISQVRIINYDTSS